MGTRYRVMVERVEDVEGAQYETRETVLFEAVSPNLASLIRFAPIEVEAALRGAAGLGDVESWDLDRAVATVPTPAGVTATVFNADGEEIPAAGAVPADERPVEAPKRKRRSRAQIVADEAAAEAAARAGEAFQQHATEAGYMTPDGPVVEAIDPAPAPAEVPPPADLIVPYNPFAPK